MNKYTSAAIHTIKTEIKGLTALLDFFDENYTKAVDLIYNCRGKIILSGMGKSGHIANKIASTLASTGTPAFFIHPGEASHGDLGMIAEQDVVILLSNSGETKELRDIIFYCQRFAIPIIGIVRKAESELAKSSAISLILPDIEEANNIKAPTTSTTMMLALGDSIAMSLVEARGFDHEKFSSLHPGGKIGASFVRTKNIMRVGNAIPLVNENASMKEALLEMTGKHLGCTGVLDSSSRLIGIITDGDLRRHLGTDLFSQTAAEVMTKNPLSIKPESLVIEAIGIMNRKAITSLFVMEDEKHVSGILHLHDCLKIGAI